MGGVPTFLTDGEGSPIGVADGAIQVTSSGTITEGALAVEFAQDGGSSDAFGRLRVSQPTTLFDSKLLGDNKPLDWDDQETSGSGTSSTYNASRSDVKMAVTANTAGTRVRQTYRHFNYYTAKSQVIFQTFVMGATGNGIVKRAGYFDGENGLFYENNAGSNYLVRRSKTSGSVVDTKIAQANWNIDKLDGTGASGFTLDNTKGQILVIDFEWLGVGRVRMGFVINGQIIYCHAFNHANDVSAVYMTSPNLPLRYEISNNGTGLADSMYAICGSVATEGMKDQIGHPHAYCDTAKITLPNTTDWFLATAMRLKSTHLHANVLIRNIQAFCETSDSISYKLCIDPTFNAALTWNAVTNSVVEVADGSASIKVTSDGHILYAGHTYGKAGNVQPTMGDFASLGSKIDGTPIVMALIVRGNTTNAKVRTALNWSE